MIKPLTELEISTADAIQRVDCNDSNQLWINLTGCDGLFGEGIFYENISEAIDDAEDMAERGQYFFSLHITPQGIGIYDLSRFAEPGDDA